MTFKEKLIWFKGKKIALCDTDEQHFNDMALFLKRYDIEVIRLSSATMMLNDLESRRYSTHRIYFAVFISANLALELEPAWQEILKINPSIAKTPLVLTFIPEELETVKPLIDKGYFQFCLTHPIEAKKTLRVLNHLSRWQASRGDITPPVTLL
ncbi:hypothetical protein JCM30760_20730 [Thiomicrorhabdus hydrogeniphila]